jgi:hypothetical protein
LRDLFKLNASKMLDESDLYANANELDSERNSVKFSKAWQREVREKSTPSLFRVIAKVFGAKVLGYGFVLACIDSTAR